MRALRQGGALLLGLLLGLSAAQADSTTNFTGDFAPGFWTNSPVGLGSVYFTNADTELVLSGPNSPSAETVSIDPFTYEGPAGGGLALGGTVEFDWAYNSGDALSTSEADFAWIILGEMSPTQIVLASGGPGMTGSGTFTTPELPAGTTFQFLVTTDTPAGKPSATLIVSDFRFHPSIPEPSTGALLASAMIALAATRRWRNPQPAARQR